MSEQIEATISETIEGELLSVGEPARLLDVGYQNYVRPEAVVAIYDRRQDDPPMLIESCVDLHRAYLVLEGGTILPAYVSATTLRKRWEALMGVGDAANR